MLFEININFNLWRSEKCRCFSWAFGFANFVLKGTWNFREFITSIFRTRNCLAVLTTFIKWPLKSLDSIHYLIRVQYDLLSCMLSASQRRNAWNLDFYYVILSSFKVPLVNYCKLFGDPMMCLYPVTFINNIRHEGRSYNEIKLIVKISQSWGSNFIVFNLFIYNFKRNHI